MTVPVPDQLEFISVADGVTKDFPYPKRFLQREEVIVAFRINNTDTIKALNIDYTIAGASWPSGGSVVFTVAPPVGVKVVRYRKTQAKQIVDLNNNQRNDAKAVEQQLDRLTMSLQDNGSETRRALKFPVGETPLNMQTIPLPERGKALVGNPNGTGYVNIKVGELSAGNSSNLLSVDVEGNISSSETPINEKTLRENGDLALASLIGQAGEIEVPVYETREAIGFAFIKGTINSVRSGGYYVPGDGGEALYKRVAIEPLHAGKVRSLDRYLPGGSTDSDNGGWWELAENVPNLLQFGVRTGAYGAVNIIAVINTECIVKGAAAWMAAQRDIRRRLVRVPVGVMEFMDFELPDNVPYMSFVGSSWNNSTLLFKSLTPGIGMLGRSIETTVLHVNLLQYITGIPGNPTIIPGRRLLHLQRPAHPELPVEQRQEPDIDATVMFCKFSRAEVGLSVIGRGLRASENLFSVNTRCIELGWGSPDDYNYGEGAQAYSAGFRAFQIQNNRFHSYSYAAVTNDGLYANELQGIIMTGNYSDIGRPLFDGVLVDAEISASVVTQTVTEALRLRGGSKRYSVSGTFSGSIEASRTPTNLIKLFGDQHAGSFEGLYLSHSREHAILHDGSGVATAMDFDGVYFEDVCLSGANFTPICFIGANHTGNLTNITLTRNSPLTGVLRTTLASANLSVSDVKFNGGAVGTPYKVGPGGKYKNEVFAEKFRFSENGNMQLMAGNGNPEGVVVAYPGCIYIDQTAAVGIERAYLKAVGNTSTGWARMNLTAL